MTKGKEARVTIALECTGCTREWTSRKFSGIHRYITRKSRRNTPTRLELRKYRPHCRKHITYKETKK
uniref:Large ribosomal subunit protein bL33c n=1 Tax=Schizaea pectinata TaxID=148576 RepID=A0A286QHM5_9MONI|nr:ribosomal protein L33 [Schizaea pectinata]APT66113.1 ribosomal protein L33 [Schizaea pectinata]